jgi:hypothetical protein
MRPIAVSSWPPRTACRWSHAHITSSPKQIGIAPEEVMARLTRLLESGVIRRIGAVPNHYAIGYTANGMSVWDVPDERIDELGVRVGALDFVTHCYHRPRRLPGMAIQPVCHGAWRFARRGAGQGGGASPRSSAATAVRMMCCFRPHSQEDRPENGA